jgi:hypothetical protein
MSVFEYRTFDDIDFLLKRDWFLDNEGIMDLLWTADQPTYDRIVDNRKAYSQRIRLLLAPVEYLPVPRKVTLCVSPTSLQKSDDAQ